jgi:hypothetical protein
MLRRGMVVAVVVGKSWLAAEIHPMIATTMISATVPSAPGSRRPCRLGGCVISLGRPWAGVSSKVAMEQE